MNINNSKLKFLSYILITSFLILLIKLNLFLCLMSSFVSYELINKINKYTEPLLGKKYSKLIIVFIISIFIILIFFFSLFNLNFFIKNIYKVNYNIDKINNIIANIEKNLPKFISLNVKSNIKNLNKNIIYIIKNNIFLINNILKYIIYKLFIILYGFIIGILISINKFKYPKKYILVQLIERFSNLSLSFKDFMVIQIKTSLINTILTSLVIILFKILGINLYFYKLIIILIFILGLLPILGNILSSIIMFISYLSTSFNYSILLIILLILIRKIEYILNIKIVKNQIKLKTWEFLSIIIIFKSLFGIEGIIIAPICYSYIKLELKYNNII